jgi:aminoglycoside phosphotransferase (APT) family kinase protein
MITDAAGRRAVIRRPPLGELLPKAHDMAREWKLITALGPTRVPVPAALAFCEDREVTGAPFYLMGYVLGHPLRWEDEVSRYVPEASRARLAFSFIEVLAELHAVDPAAAGLADLGRPDSYLGRQITTWYKSWVASMAPAEYDDPRAHALQRFMLEHLPDQGPARIVHGDYGLHNCLVLEDGSIAAVLDWELSTLGDPLADAAYALMKFSDPTDRKPPVAGIPTAAPGFPSRTELTARYAEHTGRNLSDLDFYFGFNMWKTAAIAHGVYARYRQGKKTTDRANLESLHASIGLSLAAAQRAFARWGAR